ncbi:LysR family transcriptional regulator [Lactiplantibacillus pentosus]|uniref:LysR family transcriptional regulator n=1 Tax=Lactiplantibacillus pentosus TaxID=1589 RepID=UPI001C1F8B8F|nr:LysR family transcriptional regulator [Lactiplantibacillus pentosus]MBU7503206.1 LysR family transcriptional regulator [Lactiplantibacillus pentosus]MDY1546231.1 LysR family transcriptional regulator [Lactiplantibacillus pentosus]
MNFTRLQYFCDVAKLHSFSQAAEQNFISQTAISQQVAKLERELDATLIDRTKLPIELTRIGKAVYKRASIMLEQYHILKGEIAQLRQTSNLLTIAYPNGATESVEKLVLPTIKTMDDLELFLVKSDLNDIQEKLLNKTVDMAVCFDSEITANEQLSTLTLAQGNYEVVVGPDYPWYQLRSINPQQLLNQSIIYVASRPNTNSYLKMKDHSKADHVPLKITATVSDIDTALLLVQLNKGITFIPDYKKINSDFHTLHRVKILNSQHQYKICLAWRKNDSNLKLKSVIQAFQR